jgi:hypothetical protein
MTKHFKKTVFLAINATVASVLLGSAGVASAWFSASDTITHCVGGGRSCVSDKFFAFKKGTRFEVFGHCDMESRRSDGLRGVIKFYSSNTDNSLYTFTYELRNDNTLGGNRSRFFANSDSFSFMRVDCYNDSGTARATGQIQKLGPF